MSHLPRQTLTSWMRQRWAYGSSAAALAERHPGALAPVRVSGWSAAAWTAAAVGLPAAGASLVVVTTALLARRLQALDHPVREAGRLAGLGHLFAGRSLAAALTRTWFPLAVLAALSSRRARRLVTVAVLVPPLVEWLQEQPSIDPLRWTALRIADDLSYGAGVWTGCWRRRTLAPLVPDLRSWPR